MLPQPVGSTKNKMSLKDQPKVLKDTVQKSITHNVNKSVKEGLEPLPCKSQIS